MDYSSGRNASMSDFVPRTSDSAPILSSTVPTVGSVSVGIEGRLDGNFAQLNSLLSPTDIESSSGPVLPIQNTGISVHDDSEDDVPAAVAVLDNITLNNKHIFPSYILALRELQSYFTLIQKSYTTDQVASVLWAIEACPDTALTAIGTPFGLSSELTPAQSLALYPGRLRTSIRMAIELFKGHLSPRLTQLLNIYSKFRTIVLDTESLPHSSVPSGSHSSTVSRFSFPFPSPFPFRIGKIRRPTGTSSLLSFPTAYT
eukprot:gene40958-54234_t